ncbi:MAG TPA: DUF2846 domain-containing protein [Candidatus Polarisedimenticolia bacterium]|nr:DUF2846 domain-containing protein [Candidatus Polarisedimenticolia bacterium]
MAVRHLFAGSMIVTGLVLALVPAAVPCRADDESDDAAYVTFSDDHPAGEARPDKALVYVVRPTKIGFAIKSFFLCDDAILGINKGSSYFFAQVDPGRHLFWSKSENVDGLELKVEAGKTYYIQQQVKMGAFRARTKLEVLDEAAGREALAKCKKYGAMTVKGRAKGQEIARDHKKDALEDVERRAKEATPGQ